MCMIMDAKNIYIKITSYNFFLICSLSVYLYTSCVSGSEKKGVAAWAGGLLCDDFKALNNITWWYNWRNDLSSYHSTLTSACKTADQYMPEFVPMVWKSNWDGIVHTNVSSSSQYILVLNEPDRAKHSNMTPQMAADIWPEVERISHGKPIVSPATASHNFHWYDEFFRICNSCRIDYVAAHGYGCNANHVMSYLEQLYHRYNRKIWLTEFSCPRSTDENQQLHLMKTLLPKLEAADYVFRYSWFSARVQGVRGNAFIHPVVSLLHNDSSELTTVGRFYNSFNGNGHSPQVVG